MLAAAGHLTDRDRDLVRLVARHRVLTNDQLAALGFSNLTTARHRLSVLVRLGVLRRFRPRRETGSAPWHYVLGPIGAALLGQEDRDERKWAPQVRADRQLALERSQRLAHMTGASWFFVALVQHSRGHGGGELRQWDSERETAEYLYNGLSADPSTHPDGMGVCGPKTAATSRSCWNTTPAASTCPSSPPSSPATPTLPATPPTWRSTCRSLLLPHSPPRADRPQGARRHRRVPRPPDRYRRPRLARHLPRLPKSVDALHDGHGPMRLIDLGDVLPDPWRIAGAQDERERREREQSELDEYRR